MTKILQPVHPNWPRPTDVPDFDKHYKRIFFRAYDLMEDQPNHYFNGALNPRRCAICSQDGSQVTFRQVSHLLPESLGNKSIFSNEECDNCNGKYAQTQDQELANMLHPQRAVGRVRGKKGLAKLKAPNGLSFVGGGNAGGPLQIAVHSDDPSVKMTIDSENKTAELQTYKPPFEPYGATMSLLRSAWLAMSPSERQRHSWALALIRGDVVIPQIELQEFFVSDWLRYVLFEVWEKTQGSTIESSTLILRLMFVNTAIIWSMPNSHDLRQIPGLVPKFEGVPESTTITGEVFLFPHPHEKTQAGTSTYKLSFSEYRRNVGVAAVHASVSLKKRLRPTTEVRLEAITETGCRKIERTTATIQRFDENGARFYLSGGNLAGNMTFHIDRKSGGLNFQASVQPQTTSLMEAKQTVDFVMAFRGENGTCKAISIDTDEIIFEGPTLGKDLDLEIRNMGALINSLIIINSTCQTELKVPQLPCANPLEAHILAKAITDGFVEFQPQGKISIMIDELIVNNVLELISAGNGVFIDFSYSSWPLSIWETEVDAGPIRRRLIGIKFEDNPDEFKRKLNGSSDGTITVNVQCEKVIDFYDRWSHAKQPMFEDQ